MILSLLNFFGEIAKLHHSQDNRNQKLNSKILSRANANNVNKGDDLQYSKTHFSRCAKGIEENGRLRWTVNLSKYVDCMWNMTKWNSPSFHLLADLINILKLACIQNEIKRKKELYRRPDCILQIMPLILIVHRKLTFTLPLWFNRQLPNSWCNLV